MVRLKRSSKEADRSKSVSAILEKLRQGSVVVEGMHDVRTLAKLGIPAITYTSALSCHMPLGRDVYVMMDLDRRGREKAERLVSVLASHGYHTDESAGRRLLLMLHTVCVEEAYKPAIEAMGIEPKE